MKWLVIILTAMFTGARLAGAINWDWLLVFSPAIIYVGFYAVLWTIVLIALIIYETVYWIKQRQCKDDTNA